MRNSVERTEVAYFMRRLYRQGLTTTSGGNISCICKGDVVAISASKLDKGELTADGVGLLTLQKQLLTPELTLSIETGMHLAIYQKCPWVKAIVHAHPPTACAFCASDEKINTRLTAEDYAIIGEPAIIPYALMGSPELAKVTAEHIGNAHCALLKNHGAIAVGATLLEAFDRLELLENAAKHTMYAKIIGKPVLLNEQQTQDLDILVGRASKTK